MYSHYQVIAVLLSHGKLPNQQPDDAFPDMNSFTTYKDVGNASASEGFGGYITAEFGREQFTSDSLQFTVGDPYEPAINSRSSKYYNQPLINGSYYTFFLRAYPQLGPGKV